MLSHVLTSAALLRWEGEATEGEIYTLFSKVASRLQNSNGYVSAYSPLLSLCTGSHNNSQLLGSTHQSKAVMNYVWPYMGKRKTPLLQSLVVLVMDLVKKYPTTSTDEPGSARRNAIYLLEKFLNGVNMAVELSDYQIAAALLGLPSILRSTKFIYLNPRAAGNYSVWLEKQRELDEAWDRRYGERNDALDRHQLGGDLYTDGHRERASRAIALLRAGEDPHASHLFGDLAEQINVFKNNTHKRFWFRGSGLWGYWAVEWCGWFWCPRERTA